MLAALALLTLAGGQQAKPVAALRDHHIGLIAVALGGDFQSRVDVPRVLGRRFLILVIVMEQLASIVIINNVGIMILVIGMLSLPAGRPASILTFRGAWKQPASRSYRFGTGVAQPRSVVTDAKCENSTGYRCRLRAETVPDTGCRLPRIVVTVPGVMSGLLVQVQSLNDHTISPYTWDDDPISGPPPGDQAFIVSYHFHQPSKRSHCTTSEELESSHLSIGKISFSSTPSANNAATFNIWS